MGAASAEHNEQNIVTVEGEGQIVIFKQIAGLLARRIVFTKQVGETRRARGTCRFDQIWFARRRIVCAGSRDSGTAGKHRQGRFQRSGIAADFDEWPLGANEKRSNTPVQ